jgi:hypothetical protein
MLFDKHAWTFNFAAQCISVFRMILGTKLLTIVFHYKALTSLQCGLLVFTDSHELNV